MARDGKGFRSRLLETGVRAVSRAAEKVLADPRGQEAIARAVELAARGRQRAGALQQRLLSAAGIPSRHEYDELAKQVARLKRKARDLSAKLEGGAGAERPHEDSPRSNGHSRPS